MNRVGQRHWVHVTRHIAYDFVFIVLGFLVASALRFGSWLPTKFSEYALSIAVCACVFTGVAYIAGLYTLYQPKRDLWWRSVAVGGALLVALLAVLAYGSVDVSSRVGRGVLLLMAPVTAALLGVHHIYLWRIGCRYRERLACLVGRSLHEKEANLFEQVNQNHTQFVGLVEVGGYQSDSPEKVLGDFKQVTDIIKRGEIDMLLCPHELLADPDAAPAIRQLRYSGVSVVSPADLCEELFHAMPVSLASSEWLLNSSGQTRVIYVQKLKRLFDIACSLAFLALLAVPLMLGVLAVKLTSRGGVFYRQQRCGRFGMPIQILKLRTMYADAERDGPQWASKNDGRLTPVGGFLRKFRIDEIPQLWAVLRGQMSFVGPRPERAEMIEVLDTEIPLFSERLMVQPGLTGWAQVNYPYGSCAEDSVRKLEYDLYYMKHMGLFLDFFILLDTVRIVVLGGAAKEPGRKLGDFSSALRALEESGADRPVTTLATYQKPAKSGTRLEGALN